MKVVELAARRLGDAPKKWVPMQCARVAIEAAIEIGIVIAVQRARADAAIALGAVRLIEELTVGSLTDAKTTRALSGTTPPPENALTIGLKRKGVPILLAGAPAALVAYLATHGGSVEAVLAATGVAIVGALAALTLYLKRGATYVTHEPTEKRHAVMGLALVLGVFWLSSAVASAIIPHSDVARVILVSLASVVARPLMLSVWIKSAERAPRRSPAPSPGA